MILTNILIRNEQKEDYQTTENLVRECFWNVYRPGCSEHFVLHKLRANPDFVSDLDFVLEKDEHIIGQIIFVKAEIKTDTGNSIPVLTMGPVCIEKAYQKQGYGKYLLDFALQKAKGLGYGAVLIEGNIGFYKNCGFDFAEKYNVRYHGLPEGEDASFFLCNELKTGYLSGVSGEYSTPSGYFVAEENPDEFEEYDSTFPKKKKLKLPGQLM